MSCTISGISSSQPDGAYLGDHVTYDVAVTNNSITESIDVRVVMYARWGGGSWQRIDTKPSLITSIAIPIGGTRVITGLNGDSVDYQAMPAMDMEIRFDAYIAKILGDDLCDSFYYTQIYLGDDGETGDTTITLSAPYISSVGKEILCTGKAPIEFLQGGVHIMLNEGLEGFDDTLATTTPDSSGNYSTTITFNEPGLKKIYAVYDSWIPFADRKTEDHTITVLPASDDYPTWIIWIIITIAVIVVLWLLYKEVR